MDYRRTTLEMMQDMANDFSPKKFGALVTALAASIAHAMALCDEKEDMKKSLRSLFAAIWAQAMLEHDHYHGQVEAPGPEFDERFTRFMERVIGGEESNG